jgi:hypothetical protein
VVGDARGLAPGQAPTAWGGELEAARDELRIRALAPPLALLAAFGLVSTGAGQSIVRVVLSMWVHELGHAVTAWFCGFLAFPGPWFTPVSSGRRPLVIVVLGAALLALAGWGWRTGRRAWAAAGAAGLLAQLVCTLLPLQAARALFTFGGDAGCMVIGAALVATLWTDPAGPLGRGWLRWGFLVIGACAFADAFHLWVVAAADHDRIPLGANEGVGLSDASTLWQQHGWTLDALTGRYVSLGLACLAALAVAWFAVVRRARARVRALGS